MVTLVLYLGTAGAYACFIIFYGLPQQCSLNLTVTGVNCGLTALLAVCSVFSNTRKYFAYLIVALSRVCDEKENSIDGN